MNDDPIASINLTHLEDLRKSGLLDETILESGIRSLRYIDIDKTIGYPTHARSAYEVPYPGTDYSRYRMFYDEANKFDPKIGDSRPKYLCKKDSKNRLYIPPKVRSILEDLSVPLYITEGEKKALKACQEGISCIAIAGLWNWSDGNKELISDFDQIALEGRTIYIVPDSHFQEPNRHGKLKNLKQAVHEMVYRLIDCGAKVYWVELTKSDIEVKLDDYLCEHTVEDFKKLPMHPIRKLTIQEMIGCCTPDTPFDEIKELLKRIAEVKFESEKTAYINKLSEKTNISVRALRTDLKSLVGNDDGNGTKENLQTTASANFQGLIDVVIDDSGNVAYLIKNGNSLEVATVWEIDKELYSPPDKKHMPFALPRANEIVEWYKTDNDQKLFEDVLIYLKRFSYLPDNQWLIVACKVFLTYLQDHQDIYYLPMVHFYAVPERGKSRTGQAMTYISFRGVHLIDLREANLFRYSEHLKATLFFDMKDLWKKAERNGAEDILLLRFQKGAKTARVLYPEKGAFQDTEYYDIYGATIIATNDPVHKILDTRCIGITMPNKPGNYESPTPEKAQELRERLTAWRAKVMNNPLPGIGIIEGLGGRLWDISKPLLQVCKLAYPQGFADLKNTLLEVAGQRVEDKRESIEDQIIEALNELSPKDLFGWKIKTSELLSNLNENRPDTHKLSSQYIGRKLKAMGVYTKIVMGLSQIHLNRKDFDVLLEQYGFSNISSGVCEKTLLNSTNSTKPTESRDFSSRELVESGRNSTETLLPESQENQGKVRIVESSRVSSGVGEEISKFNVIDLSSSELLEVTE